MEKIDPIDWPSLNKELQGERFEDALPFVSKILVDKVNQMVDAFNEHS